MLIDPKEKAPLPPQTPPAVEMLFLSFLAHFLCCRADPFRLSWGLKVEHDENKIKKAD